LSVRRLLIWLRKIALRAGMRYTFEVNNERFRALVRRRFERILADLAARGAWHDFRVLTDEGVTTADDLDNGRLIIALQVAPTSPVEFITVALVRSGEGLLKVAEG
jgi:phage tail sheath protein FI